jgi:hypothetical protein
MAGADIHNQGIWSSRQTGQRTPKSLVHSLSHLMFDHRTMQVVIKSYHINE